MALKVWGEPLLTADATGTRVYSPIKFNKNVILIAMRFRLIFNNDPALTTVLGKVYTDDGGTAPDTLLATSTDSRTKAELTTLGSGVVESYVTFDEIHLAKDTLYHWVPNMTGYTGTASSHIALEKAYPDPVVRISTFSYSDLLRNNFYVYPIFSEL